MSSWKLRNRREEGKGEIAYIVSDLRLPHLDVLRRNPLYRPRRVDDAGPGGPRADVDTDVVVLTRSAAIPSENSMSPADSTSLGNKLEDVEGISHLSCSGTSLLANRTILSDGRAGVGYLMVAAMTRLSRIGLLIR